MWTLRIEILHVNDLRGKKKISPIGVKTKNLKHNTCKSYLQSKWNFITSNDRMKTYWV